MVDRGHLTERGARYVKGICKRCVATIGRPPLRGTEAISPKGLVHFVIGDETACGKNAAGAEWSRRS